MVRVSKTFIWLTIKLIVLFQWFNLQMVGWIKKPLIVILQHGRQKMQRPLWRFRIRIMVVPMADQQTFQLIIWKLLVILIFMMNVKHRLMMRRLLNSLKKQRLKNKYLVKKQWLNYLLMKLFMWVPRKKQCILERSIVPIQMKQQEPLRLFKKNKQGNKFLVQWMRLMGLIRLNIRLRWIRQHQVNVCLKRWLSLPKKIRLVINTLQGMMAQMPIKVIIQMWTSSKHFTTIWFQVIVWCLFWMKIFLKPSMVKSLSMKKGKTNWSINKQIFGNIVMRKRQRRQVLICSKLLGWLMRKWNVRIFVSLWMIWRLMTILLNKIQPWKTLSQQVSCWPLILIQACIQAILLMRVVIRKMRLRTQELSIQPITMVSLQTLMCMWQKNISIPLLWRIKLLSCLLVTLP